MGQVIAAVAYWLVTSVGVPLAVVNTALVMGFNAILSTVSSKLFGPKASRAAGLGSIQIMARSGIEHRKIVYGQAAVSGPLYYNNVSGTNGEYLWYGIALADGASEDLVSVMLDQDVIPKADISWTAGTGASDGSGTGNVSTSKWVGDNSTPGVQLYYYLGDADQPVAGVLDTAFSDVTSNFRLRGVTHLLCKFRRDEDTASVWQNGQPQNIKVVLKGRKIYDPRLDSTQIIDPTTSPVTYGSSTHRAATASTWTYSDNPALCIADYLLNVMGVAETSVDWQSVAESADDCDVLVVVPPAASPENQEKRFTCNGALSLGSSHKDNLDAILSSMDGKLSYSGGVWKVRASVWESASVTITESDFAGGIDVRGSAPKSERFSRIRGFFIDPDRNYEAAEFPHLSSSTYLTRDNSEEITYDLQLPMTNSVSMAQRIALRNLEQADNQVIAKLKMNSRAVKIAVGDIVSLTVASLGWSTKAFRCIEWKRDSGGSYDVTLKEDYSTSYTDPAVGDYGTGNTGGVTIPANVVPAPSALTATAESAGVRLAWTNPPAATYDEIIVYEQTTNTWGSPEPTIVWRGRANGYLVPHNKDSTDYYYWVRAVRLPSVLSSRFPDSDTSTITATMAAAPPTEAVTAYGGFIFDSSISPTTANAGIRVDSDGDIYTRTGPSGSWTSIGTWLNTGAPGDYDVGLFDDGTGTGETPTGTAYDEWLDGGTDRTWELADTSTAGVAKSFEATLKIRNGTTFSILSTAAVDLTAFMAAA